MSINTKIQNNYLYNGLGFPIILERADFKKIGGKWLLKIDIKKLSEKVIRALPYKPVGLIGAEIRFIRTYFDLSKRNARNGRNPKTGEVIQIAAKNTIRFKAGSELSSSVN